MSILNKEEPEPNFPNIPEPVHNIPRRSTRHARPTEKDAAAQNIPYQSRVKKAIAESRESAARLKATRGEKNMDLGTEPGEGGEEQTTRDAAFTITAKACTIAEEPRTWEEAKTSSRGAEWLGSYLDKLTQMKKMKVYTLVPRSSVPKGRKIITSRPVFTTKFNSENEPVRDKVRLVARGHLMKDGIDYDKTYAPTARNEATRALLHIGVSLDWEIHHVDVKTVFLKPVDGATKRL